MGRVVFDGGDLLKHGFLAAFFWVSGIFLLVYLIRFLQPGEEQHILEERNLCSIRTWTRWKVCLWRRVENQVKRLAWKWSGKTLSLDLTRETIDDAVFLSMICLWTWKYIHTFILYVYWVHLLRFATVNWKHNTNFSHFNFFFYVGGKIRTPTSW